MFKIAEKMDLKLEIKIIPKKAADSRLFNMASNEKMKRNSQKLM